jgi:hypothetical protein
MADNLPPSDFIIMGVRGWLRDRLANSSSSPLQALDLLTDQPGQLELPALAGIDITGAVRPWSVARLELIMREAAVSLSPATLQAARQARHCLSSFWLAAPTDQLQELYTGAIGALQRLQLEGPLVRQPLAFDEQRWLNQLTQQLVSPEQKPRQHNLLLAAMPYTRPGQFCVGNPLEKLPDWLLADYAAYCDPELLAQLREPVGLLEPASEDAVESAEMTLHQLEPLSKHRGDEAMAWFRDEQAVARMTDLIHRYKNDPSDQDVLEELSGLRCIVAQLWLDIESEQGETLYNMPVGAITRALIRANFGRELVDDQDQRIRAAMTQPDSAEALLAMLLFYPAGAIRLSDSSTLPAWLAQDLDTLQ